MTFPKTGLALVFGACLLGAGCGGNGTTGINGSSKDGGTGGDDVHADAIITPDVPQDARRGPIALSFDIVDPDHALGDLKLSFSPDGTTFSPATLMFEAHDDTSARYVWNSFADVDVDGDVELELTAKDGDAVVTLPFTLDVRNDPSDDRLVLVGHSIGDDYSESGHTLTAFVWSGLAPGGVVGDASTIPVGVGPMQLRAAPHGRATAVLEQTDGTVSLVSTPLDALVDGVQRTLTATLPYGSPMDLRWSADGRFLYVIGSRSDDDASPATLWRYFPSEDLTYLGDPDALATLPGPPLALATDPVNDRLLVYCGSGGVAGEKDKLVLYGDDGHEIARLSDDLDPPGDLEISPSGDTALYTSDFGAGVRRYALGSDSITQVGNPIEIDNSLYVVFHPGSTSEHAAALVSQLNSNTVTPLSLSADTTTPGGALAGFPLSAEMDLIERGDETGTVLIPGVSGSTDDSLVNWATLSLDGTATSQGVALDLGDTVDAIPEGISIQR